MAQPFQCASFWFDNHSINGYSSSNWHVCDSKASMQWKAMIEAKMACCT